MALRCCLPSERPLHFPWVEWALKTRLLNATLSPRPSPSPWGGITPWSRLAELAAAPAFLRKGCFPLPPLAACLHKCALLARPLTPGQPWMRLLHTGGWSEAAHPRGGLRPGPGHAAAVGRRRQGKGLVCSWWQRVPAGERCWWGSVLGQPVCSARTEVSRCHLCGSATMRGQSRGTAGPARAFACCTSPTAVGKPLSAAACSPPQPVAPRFLSPPVLSPGSCFRCLTLRHMESSSFCGFADLLPDPLRD